MKKKIIIVLMICIGFIVFNEIRTPFLFWNEYYIVNFENTKAQLTESEKNDLIKLLRLEDYSFEKSYFIEITKIAYQEGPFNDVGGYIFFKTNVKDIKLKILGDASIKHGKENDEYIYQHIDLGDGCQEYQIIKKLVKRHYNWLGRKEKKLNFS